MRKMKSINVWLVLAFVTSVAAVSSNVKAQERPGEVGPPGPPAWVIESWESGEAPVIPANGPPAWVVRAWESGERPTRPSGPPPWVAARHEMALELGLPGPPDEVIEAWKNGEGADLPGPPGIVFDLLGF